MSGQLPHIRPRSRPECSPVGTQRITNEEIRTRSVEREAMASEKVKTFTDYSPLAFLGALGRALELFDDQPAWRRVQRAGMGGDFSWDASAREYVKVYERAASASRAAAL